jgi:hypothetical protein
MENPFLWVNVGSFGRSDAHYNGSGCDLLTKTADEPLNDRKWNASGHPREQLIRNGAAMCSDFVNA